VPGNRVNSYFDSYHGLAAEGGSLVAANCSSCHGVHNILPSSDPHSTINRANLDAPAASATKALRKSSRRQGCTRKTAFLRAISARWR